MNEKQLNIQAGIINMSQEYLLDNLNTELENFIMAKARDIAYISRPLVFKLDNKNKPIIIDEATNIYEIEIKELQSFKSIIYDHTFKFIRLQNWQFELQYDGKQCLKIILISDYVVFLINKNNKKQIKDCTFKIIIAEKQSIQKLSIHLKGYLNRIGKRNLINNSNNVSLQFYSLINFIKRQKQEIYQPFLQLNEAEIQEQDALQLLNNDGKRLLQKLRQFITKQDINNFMIDQELSRDGQEKIRKIIRNEQSSQKKKIPRNIQQSILKHAHE